MTSLRGLSLLLLVLLVAYMAWSWGKFPGMVPMQWDAQNRPLWFASRTTFFVWFIGLTLFLNALFTFIPVPQLAIAGLVTNAVLLLLFHVVYQQVAPARFLYLPVDAAVYVILVLTLLSVASVVTFAIRQAR